MIFLVYGSLILLPTPYLISHARTQQTRSVA
jgi:hypothetical protein